jgi:hypothetical protein
MIPREIEAFAGDHLRKAVAAFAQAGEALRACAVRQASEQKAACESAACDGRPNAQR